MDLTCEARWNHILLALLSFFLILIVGCAGQGVSILSSATPMASSSNKELSNQDDKDFLDDDFGDVADKEAQKEADDFLADDFGDVADEEAEEGSDDFLDNGFGDTKKPVVKTSEQIADPIAPWNRAMFHFNDKVYFWLLKPVAQGYKAVVPKPIRVGVKNFFHNLSAPIRLTNCLLQGKINNAGIELGRFMVNSTWGVLGFGDPATNILELNPPADNEDFGQTLATYGVGNGFYIVWPLLGPSTLRDTFGKIGDWFLYPISYVEPMEASTGINAYEKVNTTSFHIGDYEALKDAAISPYEAFRNAYIQYRKKQVNE